MKRKFMFVLMVVMAGALLLGACGPAQNAPASPASTYSQMNQINVSGSGEIYMAPDLAYITIGVRSESENADSAMDDNNVLANAVKAALIGIGIAEEDIQTTAFNVFWNDKWNPDNTTTKVYSIENMMDVTVRNVDQLEDVLDAALGAGANSVYNIRFDVADKAEAFSKARTLAVQNAQKQAAELAVAAGVELGDLITINSYGGSVTPVSNYYGYGMGGGGMAETAQGVPVSSGQIIISISVNLVYQIK
ncbi:MAG: SIMPL domain-containing protein [Anaerolineae bacterium]|nr:SIMPL domain-containing protein [Anaerolineae bacterium]